ncbi:MAG: ABC transporter substrate-binding protein [Actinomycetota bacterium]
MLTSSTDRSGILDDLTRREFITGLTAAGLLAACGGPQRPDNTAEPGRVRTIKHGFGESQLEGVPARIMTINDRCEFDAMLALGVKPALCGLMEGEPAPWRRPGDFDGVETFPGYQGIGSDINVEQVAALRPDLILGPTVFAELDQVKLLQGVAPVVGTDSVKPEGFGWWKDVLAQAAEILERTDRVDAVVQQTERVLDQGAQSFRDFGFRKVTLFATYDSGPYVFSEFNAQGALLERLGLDRPDSQKEQFTDARAGYELSLERLDVLDSDLVLRMHYDPAVSDDFEANPLFQAIPAVADGRYIRLSADLSAAIYYHSPLSFPWALEQLERALRATRG